MREKQILAKQISSLGGLIFEIGRSKSCINFFGSQNTLLDHVGVLTPRHSNHCPRIADFEVTSKRQIMHSQRKTYVLRHERRWIREKVP